MIRNIDKIDHGVIDGGMELMGEIEFRLQVHDSYLRYMGVYPDENRRWHDISMTVYQSIDSYSCPDCEVGFIPLSMSVIEDQCDRHDVDDIVVKGLDGEADFNIGDVL